VERRYAAQEPELRHVASLVRPGSVAVDVGGWLGPWTRALARTARHVHTFEPQPNLAAHLRRVVGPNVTVHEAAVGASSGLAHLAVDARPGRDALAHLAGDGFEVSMVALDDLDLGDVGFVKIDVEGHEAAVLDGARGLLDRCRPTVLMEAEQRHLSGPLSELLAVLVGRGWSAWFLRDGTWRPVAEFDVERDQLAWVDHLPHRSYTNNFLFRPDPGPPPR
jgi:FkbM family methyltransferase